MNDKQVLATYIDNDKIIMKKSDKNFNENRYGQLFSIPNFLKDNLKHDFREYQRSAIENLIILSSESPVLEDRRHDYFEKGIVNENHYLFHMATGSGKTMIIASTILYMYKLGYKKFIFFTDSNNLITKTKNNLLPQLRSNKCEYKEKIYIDGREVKIIEKVDNFSMYGDDIEILFTTINTLHNRITEKKENSITLDNLKKHNICMLADEAHHFQVDSKGNFTGGTDESKKNNQNWETTIQKILNISNDNNEQKNKLIEFTATMDLKNPLLYEKYKDKIVFDYTLSKFREDGYSKDITLVVEEDEKEKILNAIVINAFRSKLGNDKYNIPNFIPKILFKCEGTIDNLLEKQNNVFSYINELTDSELQSLIMKHYDLINETNYRKGIPAYKHIKEYILDGDKLNEFLNEIKLNYQSGTTIYIHSKESKADKEKKMIILNNIDNNQNIRMIFAIDILNEGWDVLSLFDIVKLDKVGKSNEYTTKDRQLIGRGARIFPFFWTDTFDNEKDPFKRKFDKNQDDDTRLFEDMYFYTSNESNYKDLLKKELIASGLLAPENETEELVQIQKSHINNADILNFVKEGKIFSNEKLLLDNEKTKIKDYKINNIELEKDYNVGTDNLTNSDDDNNLSGGISKNITFYDFCFKNNENIFILNKVLKGSQFFTLNNLSLYIKIGKGFNLIDEIKSISANINLVIKGRSLEDLSYNNKLSIINAVLKEVEILIIRNKDQFIGTKEFKKEFDFSKMFRPYYKKRSYVAGYNGPITGKNAYGKELTTNIQIENKDLFYYDLITWDSELEINLFSLLSENLSSSEYLVVRNEVSFKFYNYDDTALSGSGFEPDFIILKRDGNNITQIFVEVKDDNNGTSDNQEWKNNLLKELKIDKTVGGYNYKVRGMPFFTEKTNKSEFIEKLKSI